MSDLNDSGIYSNSSDPIAIQVLDVVLVKGDQKIETYLPFGDAKFLYETIMRFSVSDVEVRITGRHILKL